MLCVSYFVLLLVLFCFLSTNPPEYLLVWLLLVFQCRGKICVTFLRNGTDVGDKGGGYWQANGEIIGQLLLEC